MSELTFETTQRWSSRERLGFRRPGDGQSDGEGELPRDYGGAARLRADRFARGLGWFSIGLGTAQVLSPRGMTRLTGVGRGSKRRLTMFGVGLRELTAGIGILSGWRPAAWLWARVAGDVMDLAMLGSTLRSRKARKARVLESMGAVAGVLVLDYLTARRASRQPQRNTLDSATGLEQVTRAVTIALPPEEVYRFWRNFENLPRFMAHLESVRVLDDRRSRWTAKGPAAKNVSWDAEITEDRPNQLIAWRSLAGAEVRNSGTVRFMNAPGGQGTIVRVDLQYDPPAGKLGATIAKLFGEEPSQQIAGDLRRFKQVMETGEVVHSDASIHRGAHAAQPPAEVPASVTAELGNVKGGTR